jgi:16S rRNA G966 N2-methylase RsmD
MDDNALVKLTAATHMLAEAKTLEEVKHILDIAEAARVYARAAKLGLEAYNHAAEVKARAERKAGEMLAQLERGKPGPKEELFNTVLDNSEYKDVLDENNINYVTAGRWQAVAEMPEDEFEKHLEDMRGEKPITTNGMLREIKDEKRMDARAKMAEAGALIPEADRWHIWQGDIATWQAPRQYDFIITDPPYPKEFLPLWEVLGRRANQWLKEGGLLIAMSGQSYLDEIYRIMGEYLEYYWTAAYLTPGQPTPLRQVNVNSTWKPLLIYQKGGYTGKIFGDVFVSDGNDKDHHKWGQSESGMLDIISKICLPGQYILDPFCGAGTTGVAALRHGCLFDGIDLEGDNVNISKARLNDTTKTRQPFD